MAFDFKKEYKEFYMPKNKPQIVNVPKANYIAVRGKGNPNEEGGAYQQAISVLYAVAYTLKMSYKTDYKIEGFFEYVVPPLEGFWWQDNVDGVNYNDYKWKVEELLFGRNLFEACFYCNGNNKWENAIPAAIQVEKENSISTMLKHTGLMRLHMEHQTQSSLKANR